MFTVSDSFWSLNLNQKLLWLLPPFLFFNVCKHQYIKKNPEGTRFGEKIKWPRIYICSLNTNIRHHQIQNIGIILEGSMDFLRMHFMNWSPTTVKVPKKIFTFFCASIMWSYCKPYEHIRSSDPWVERLTIKKDGVITMHSVYIHLL